MTKRNFSFFSTENKQEDELFTEPFTKYYKCARTDLSTDSNDGSLFKCICHLSIGDNNLICSIDVVDNLDGDKPPPLISSSSSHDILSSIDGSSINDRHLAFLLSELFTAWAKCQPNFELLTTFYNEGGVAVIAVHDMQADMKIVAGRVVCVGDLPQQMHFDALEKHFDHGFPNGHNALYAIQFVKKNLGLFIHCFAFFLFIH